MHISRAAKDLLKSVDVKALNTLQTMSLDRLLDPADYTNYKDLLDNPTSRMLHLFKIELFNLNMPVVRVGDETGVIFSRAEADKIAGSLFIELPQLLEAINELKTVTGVKRRRSNGGAHSEEATTSAGDATVDVTIKRQRDFSSSSLADAAGSGASAYEPSSGAIPRRQNAGSFGAPAAKSTGVPSAIPSYEFTLSTSAEPFRDPYGVQSPFSIRQRDLTFVPPLVLRIPGSVGSRPSMETTTLGEAPAIARAASADSVAAPTKAAAARFFQLATSSLDKAMAKLPAVSTAPISGKPATRVPSKEDGEVSDSNDDVTARPAKSS